MFAHIGRVDHFPRYGAPLWMVAEPAEKRRSAQVITLTGYLAGLPVEAMLRVTLRPPQVMEFKQVRGTLRALSGKCTLQTVEDGTEVRYRLEVDPGISMLSDEAAHQFLVQFVERMLDRIKLAAERKASPRRVDRVSAAEPAGPEAEEDEAEPIAAGAGPAIASVDEQGAQTTPRSAPARETAPPPSTHTAPSRAPTGPAEPPRSGRRRRRHRGRKRAAGPPGPPAPPAG